LPQPDTHGLDLYWLPLGAGGHFVRFNGRLYETVLASLQRRPRRDLYHSALEVHLPNGRYVIEMAPIPGHAAPRGVVAEGPVGAGLLGGMRLFRYEVRRWRNGDIPDLVDAVESPQRLTGDVEVAARLVELVPKVPTYVWGRDVLGVHDMWNSNSLISWLLVSAGVDVARVNVPHNGRAPGWRAGIAAALS